jgi:hypothetical protein
VCAPRYRQNARCRIDGSLYQLFGAKQRPCSKSGADLSSRQAVVIETPRSDLTLS